MIGLLLRTWRWLFPPRHNVLLVDPTPSEPRAFPRKFAEAQSKLERDLIEGMEAFIAKLKSDEPIEATRITIEHTPDGPLTTSEKVMIFGREV